jgi:hypothetical protein
MSRSLLHQQGRAIRAEAQAMIGNERWSKRYGLRQKASGGGCALRTISVKRFVVEIFSVGKKRFFHQ